jgi:predicted nucleotidyltransferase
MSNMDAARQNAVLDEILRRLTPAVPGLRKVILFGSAARGQAASDSDLDLLVVVDSALPRAQRYLRISRLLRGIGVAVDLIVQTPDEHAANSQKYWSVTAQATQNGRVLYEAA